MFITNSGINNLYILNDDYYDLSDFLTIQILDSNNQIIKTFNSNYISNIRNIIFEFEIVESIEEENLLLKKIYLKKGFFEIKIYMDEIEYLRNILFVGTLSDINIKSIESNISIKTIND